MFGGGPIMILSRVAIALLLAEEPPGSGPAQ